MEIKQKKIDLCYFLNEIDLLEIRFEILNDYVDEFIVIECTQTFSGMQKELAFDIERYAKWKHKIKYYVVDDYPQDYAIFEMATNSPNTGGIQPWIREFYIKESAQKALTHLQDNDIVFISDLDEIWNPALEYNPTESEVLKPKQLSYLYFLNQRTDEDWLGWTGTTCCLYKTIKDGCINHIRTDDLTPYTILENGGWHFCSIGGKRDKMKTWQHPDYDTFVEAVWERRAKGSRAEEKDLPQYLIENKQKWISLFL